MSESWRLTESINEARRLRELIVRLTEQADLMKHSNKPDVTACGIAILQIIAKAEQET